MNDGGGKQFTSLSAVKISICSFSQLLFPLYYNNALKTTEMGEPCHLS
jgi:hypothetical protein